MSGMNAGSKIGKVMAVPRNEMTTRPGRLRNRTNHDKQCNCPSGKVESFVTFKFPSGVLGRAGCLMTLKRSFESKHWSGLLRARSCRHFIPRNTFSTICNGL